MAREKKEKKNDGSFDVITDAGMVVLFDASHFASIVDQDSWETELLDDEDIERHVRAGHLVALSSGSDGAFRIDVRLFGALKPAEEKKLGERAPACVFESKGAAFVAGIEYVHGSPDRAVATAVPLGVGRWSITACSLEGGKALADVVVLVDFAAEPSTAGSSVEGAAAPPAEAAAEPGTKAPRKATATKAGTKAGTGEAKATKAGAATEKVSDAKPKNLKQAREVALAGDIDRALPVLEAEARKGTGSAWAALAQIRAYRCDWNGALDAAAKLLADPNDIYAGNVIDEAKWVVLKAARETGRWADARVAIEKARPLREGATHPFDTVVVEQAASGGKLPDPPYERPDEQRAQLTPEQKRELYDKWMRAFDDDKKKKKRKPGDRESAQFAYANAYGQDAIAMEVWPAVEPGKLWHDAVKAARLFIRNGRSEEAWAILERKIRHFWPVDVGQIAPVEPLVDEALRTIMTPERYAQLLTAPKKAEL